MKRLFSVAGGLAIAGSYFVLSGVPAFSADSGTVNAQVTAMEACITVSPTTTVNFGTQPLSSPSLTSIASGAALGFTNCSTAQESVFVRGTDATGSTATWALGAGGCSPGTNNYGIRFGDVVDGAYVEVLQLSTTNQGAPNASTPGAPNTYAAGATRSYDPRLIMPCTGSNGTGQTMAMQFIFTATF